MKKLTTSLCLIFAVLFGSVGVSWSADFEKGLAAYSSGNFATALREWTPLAEQGHAAAQFNLGVMYDDGEGVPQDYKIAIKWYTLAAKQGYARAQTMLGVMYTDGQGVPQDDVYAHMWLNIAVSSGDKAASIARDRVAKRMTPTQRDKAQDLARACVRKQYNGC